MTKPYLTNPMLERAAAMRERGISVQRIATTIGCSRSVLAWHFLRLGVEPPKPRQPLRPNYHLERPVMQRGRFLVRAFTPQEDEKLLTLESQGLGYSAIGRVLGRKHNSVQGRLMILARRAERAANGTHPAPATPEAIHASASTQ